MSDFLLNWYVRLFDSLKMDSKIRLLSVLAERLNSSYNHTVDTSIPSSSEKIALLRSLAGSWKDAAIDGDEIVAARTYSSRNIEW
jgi:hypothetical protein